MSNPRIASDDLEREDESGSDRTFPADERTRADGQADDPRREKEDGGESGEDGPQKPVGFWHKGLGRTRMKVFGLWAGTTIMLSAFILAVLSLYWGVLFNVEDNLNSLIVYVVNFETQPSALIGPMITQATEAIVATNRQPHLGFITVPPSAFDNDPLAVRRAVYNWEAWAAIIINSNATTLLRQAVELGNSSFDPLGTCQIIYQSARDETTNSNYILPQLNKLQTEVISMFGRQWATQVLANNSIPRTTLQRVPQALNPAIGFSTFDLRPFYPPVATPAVTIGLIYLIIVAFFSFTFYLPIHTKFITPGQGHPVLKFWQLIIWRWLSTLVAYLVMSLAYSLISLAFQIPFSHDHAPETVVAEGANAFGKATFVVYWMVNWVGMAALGLACENVAMVIGQPWTAMWLIFWVIANVSTSFYAEELSPAFYNWGYAWPLHSIVEASRTLIFDVKNRLGLDFGILFAWVGINSVLFPLCCYVMKWKMEKGKKKEQGKKDR